MVENIELKALKLPGNSYTPGKKLTLLILILESIH